MPNPKPRNETVGAKMVRMSSPAYRKAAKFNANTKNMVNTVSKLVALIAGKLDGEEVRNASGSSWSVSARATCDNLPPRWVNVRTKMLFEALEMPVDSRKDFTVKWSENGSSVYVRVKRNDVEKVDEEEWAELDTKQ